MNLPPSQAESLALHKTSHFRGNTMNPFHALTFALLFTAQAAQATGDMSDAEVRKVDKDNKKLTLKHGEIKNLDMPGMTMVFAVKEPGMVDKVKAGDKVKFKAEKINGTYTVTDIQPAP
jgi:Cu/Ag efflux protein CusF